MRKFIALLRSFDINDLAAAEQYPAKYPAITAFYKDLETYITQHHSKQVPLEIIANEIESEIEITPVDRSTLYKVQIMITASQKQPREQREKHALLTTILIDLRKVLIERISDYDQVHTGLVKTYLELLKRIRCKNDGTLELQTRVDEAIGAIQAWSAKDAQDKVEVSKRSVGNLAVIFNEIFQEYPCPESNYLNCALKQPFSRLVQPLAAEVYELDEIQQSLEGFFDKQAMGDIPDIIESWKLPIHHQNLYYNQLHAYVFAHENKIKQAAINSNYTKQTFAEAAFNLYCRGLDTIYGCLELLNRSRETASPGLYAWIDASIAKLENWKSKPHSPVLQYDVEMLIETVGMLAKFRNSDPYSHVAYQYLTAYPIDTIRYDFAKDADEDITNEFRALVNNYRLMDIPAVIAAHFGEREYAKQHFMREFCKFQIENAYSIFKEHRASNLYTDIINDAVPQDANKTAAALQAERNVFAKQLICRQFIENIMQYIRATSWQLGALGGVKLQGLDTFAPKNVAAIYKLCLEAEKDGNWAQHFDDIVNIGTKASNAWRINFFGLNKRSAEAQDLYDRCKRFHINGAAYQEKQKENFTKRMRMS